MLIVAEKSELDGDMESCARMALCESGIAVSGKPDCAAYTAGGETLLFARAGAPSAFYRFSSAEKLIDAARHYNRAGYEGAAEVYRSQDGYIAKLSTPCPGLADYGEQLEHFQTDGLQRLDSKAWERLGK